MPPFPEDHLDQPFGADRSADYPRILLESEVADLTRLSSVTIWRMERKGTFPKRIKLGEKRIGWIDAEVRAWFSDRMSERTNTAA